MGLLNDKYFEEKYGKKNRIKMFKEIEVTCKLKKDNEICKWTDNPCSFGECIELKNKLKLLRQKELGMS